MTKNNIIGQTEFYNQKIEFRQQTKLTIMFEYDIPRKQVETTIFSIYQCDESV